MLKRSWNDAADAEAICEAVRRTTIRFVRVKSAEQQGQLMQHRTRDLLMRQRTQVINARASGPDFAAWIGACATRGFDWRQTEARSDRSRATATYGAYLLSALIRSCVAPNIARRNIPG
jgi:transposase